MEHSLMTHWADVRATLKQLAYLIIELHINIRHRHHVSWRLITDGRRPFYTIDKSVIGRTYLYLKGVRSVSLIRRSAEYCCLFIELKEVFRSWLSFSWLSKFGMAVNSNSINMDHDSWHWLVLFGNDQTQECPVAPLVEHDGSSSNVCPG